MIGVKPRNPRLYEMLRRLYGKVKISRPGEPYQYRTAVVDGRTRVERTRGGEEYSVCCPLCGDKRNRLGVNHMFGQYVEGVAMGGLAHCYNCEDNDRICAELIQNLRTFEDCSDLPSVEAVLTSEAPNLSQIAEECNKNFLKLDGVTRMDAIPMDHPAFRYLVSRQYDVKHLAEYMGVGYCFNTEYSVRSAHKRIIIPILYENKYIGWQARAIPNHSKLTLLEGKENKSWPYKEPKYWTSPGLMKSHFLYNFDLARHTSPDVVVVVEGTTDAWRVGNSGVAILGRVISESQIHMLVSVWGDKKIMLLGDPGFEADWAKNMKRIGDKMTGGLVDLYIGDRDPGDTSTDQIKEIVHGRLGL